MSRPPPPNGYRNMSNGSALSLSQPGLRSSQPSHVSSSTQGASRAERFEDEKRRLIDSCFAKTDQGGQLAESYITHIRIQEDANYPSSPPPPESPPEAKKPRLIVIAVRSTGRVRMHKARENTNGSFSIGKTWNLEELSAIESFCSVDEAPANEKEAQQRQWAGNTGFTVTITKPYYWQAGTSKEKDFFIASAVKIYKKYTKGQVPDLKGFDERDRSQMMGLAPAQQAQQQGLPPPGLRQASNGRQSPSPQPPHPPFAQRDQSRDGSRYRGSPGPPPSISDPHSRGTSTDPTRLTSESSTRFAGFSNASAGPGNGPAGPRPFASQEQIGALSPSMRQEFRPGTSPAPMPGYARSPAQQQIQTPSDTSSVSHLRSDSPALSSVSSDRGALPKVLNSPRQRMAPQQQQQPSDNGLRDHRTDAQPATAAANGAGLFQATRQRWMDEEQPQPSQARRSLSPVPQLPPIQTSQPLSTGIDRRTPTDARDPQTAVSEVSSAGIDLGDAATIGALTAYWGPEPTPAVPTPPPQPVVHEPPNMTTPERSKKRPPVDPNLAVDGPDLRPPPLSQRNKSPAGGSNYYGTPRDGSAVPTPRTEEPPEIKPLSVPNKLSSPNPSGLPMPGAFSPGPLGASPAGGSPAETPRDEPSQEEATRQPEEHEQFRPGLGPMIKKGTARDRFQKAARAANAFKPRPGGAAEKIMKAKAEREAGVAAEPDGISGVVPRPQGGRMESAQGQRGQEPEGSSVKDDLAVKPVASGPEQPPQARPRSPPAPKVEVSSPLEKARAAALPSMMDGPHGVQLTDEPSTAYLQTPDQEAAAREQAEQEAEERVRLEQKEMAQRQVKVKRRSQHQNLYLDELGVDRTLLEGRGLDFESMLDEFGWKDAALQPNALADMETSLRREQGRVEAGSWLNIGNATDPVRDEKVMQVESLLDKCIRECDELDGLLTLYSVELGSLNEDIAYVEAQSQGLQVQSANQKLLYNELQGLVDTMSLSRRVMDPLRYNDLGDVHAVEEVEGSLVKLYQAMATINPSIRSTVNGSRPKSRTGFGGEGSNELSSMRAVMEKKDTFDREAQQFCQRLIQHLDSTFTVNFNDAKRHAMRPMSSGVGAGLSAGAGAMVRINKDAYADARRGLWVYSPLLLFTKELNPPAWQTVLRMYYGRVQVVYVDSFPQNVAGWKRVARKPGPEEAELLFTAQEKEDPTPGGGGMGLAAARKLTVKRSQTLAKTLRNASGGDKHSPIESRRPGTSLMASEVFAGAMDEMAPLVSQEQNFLVDLFHATSLEGTDFMEVVQATPPDARRGTNLLDRKPVEPDREMAKRVQLAMAQIFDKAFNAEMGSLLDWSIVSDPIQGVGVLACLNRHAFYLQDTSQEFLLQLTETLTTKLQGLWAKFVDEQVKAIEDTKVKIKKRKGVIAFMKTFPHFSAAVENVFSAVAGLDYDGPAPCVAEVRQLIDEAYGRLNHAMFDSLKVIAKESPITGAQAGTQAARAQGEDHEDKQMLNYHILIIENMNHYIEEVDDGGKQGVLAEWRGKAMLERMEALEAYVGRVMRRPLGKLMDFLDATESLLTSHPTNPTAIASRPSYSRKAARNLLAQYDSKEVRRGIDTLRKRIDKHFGDADEEALAQKLVGFVGAECERAYGKVLERTERLIREVYPVTEGEKAVEADFSKADLQAGFKR